MPHERTELEVLLQRWNPVIRSCFTHQIEIRSRVLDGKPMIVVDWPLAREVLGWRRSRQLVLIVSAEVMSRYRGSSETHQLVVNDRLRALITEALLGFNPRHARPLYQPAPIFTVWVGAKVLFDTQ